jgi:hypothetical protein
MSAYAAESSAVAYFGIYLVAEKPGFVAGPLLPALTWYRVPDTVTCKTSLAVGVLTTVLVKLA